MSGRRVVTVLIASAVILILNFSFLSAAEDNSIRWEPVHGAGGYILEIRNSQKRIIVEKELTGTSYNISKLPAGNYQYRLTTLNKLKRKGDSTSWVNLSIARAVVPVLTKVSNRILSHSFNNPDIIITGENFFQNTKLYLKNSTEKIELKTMFISGSELKVSFNSENKITGEYDLVAANYEGFEAVMPSAIEVIDPDIPVLETVSQNQIYNSAESEIIIKGKNLGGDILIHIADSKGNIISANQNNLSDSEIAVKLNPGIGEKGIYTITAVKRNYFPSNEKMQIEVVDRKVSVSGSHTEDKTKQPEASIQRELIGLLGLRVLYVGAGIEYNIPYGDWSSKLDPSITGFHLYMAYPLLNVPLIKKVPVLNRCGVEGLLNYTDYKFADAAGDESLLKISGYAGLNYSITPGFFSNNYSLIFNVDGGIAYSTMNILLNNKLIDYTSIDPAVKGGISLRYRWFNSFFTDLSAEYGRVFYLNHPLDEAKISFRAGIML